MPYIVQLEHSVRSWDEWKQVFDSDPLKREQSGVKRYRIGRLLDNPDYVVGELEFADRERADDFLMRLNALWGTGQARVVENPRGRVVEIIDSKEY